jgi:D-aspartate ligase
MAPGRRESARSAIGSSTGFDSAVAFDTSVPAFVLRLNHNIRGHGAVGAIRTLGRAGVPVYAITEDRWTPAGVSRYLTGRTVNPTTGFEGDEYLLDLVISIAKSMGRRGVVVPTDDDAAVFVAEHASQLSEWLISPDVAPDLPRRLASKRGLRELCLEHSTATPGPPQP